MVTSRQDSTAIGIVASTVSVHKTLDTFAEEKNKELEMATGIRPYQYEPVADINFGINWESSSDEEVP